MLRDHEGWCWWIILRNYAKRLCWMNMLNNTVGLWWGIILKGYAVEPCYIIMLKDQNEGLCWESNHPLHPPLHPYLLTMSQQQPLLLALLLVHVLPGGLKVPKVGEW
jgi:hypothetical protein